MTKYIIISLLALGMNIPMGYVRERFAKFSFGWFFWIHASIPFIIYARVQFGTSKMYIPVTILLAIAGQIIGSRWKRQQVAGLSR